MSSTTEIQDKEIRGITIKVIISLLFSTIGIVATILSSFSKLESKIEVNQIRVDSRNQMQDYEIQRIKGQDDEQDVKINELERYMNENRSLIDDLRKRKTR